ncbi:MAG TPA: hypothetical protein VM324_16725 [Egibacteraceae bacterium]|nr:hypothetical protein [Egibacteraceae bacterium]
MTTIKTHCPACGEVELAPDDIELRADADAGPESFYAFGCPGCRLHVRKRADERVVRLLVTAGVPCLSLNPSRAGGPAITCDDLLDFHALLATDGWFDRLLELVEH